MDTGCAQGNTTETPALDPKQGEIGKLMKFDTQLLGFFIIRISTIVEWITIETQGKYGFTFFTIKITKRVQLSLMYRFPPSPPVWPTR